MGEALSFDEAAKRSREDFERFVLGPAERMLGGKIIRNEGQALDLQGPDLDRRNAVDYFLRRPDGTTLGIAARVQWQEWRSFTVRTARESGVRTERQKLKELIETHSLAPSFHIQAYIAEDRGRLLCFSIGRIVDVLRFIDDGHAGEPKCTRDGQIGKAWFYIVWWNRFDHFGNWRLEYPKDYDRDRCVVQRDAGRPKQYGLFADDHYQHQRRG